MDPSKRDPASQEHTAVVFAEEVRGLHEQVGEIKNLLNSSWYLGVTVVEDSDQRSEWGGFLLMISLGSSFFV